MIKLSISVMAIALSLLSLSACGNPKAETPKPEAAPTSTTKVINQREDAAK